MSADVEALASLLAGRPFVALTGAGCSTESGIPDYRGEGTRMRARNPMQYRAFLHEPAARVRYWARSMIGWPRIESARPNAAHHALARMESAGLLGLITQNVDRLHTAAGSARVIELHGALAEVRCLACGTIESRARIQEQLALANPTFLTARAAETNPDGDVELPDDALEGFRVIACAACGGVLKPDVVFFGDSVPKPRVEAAHALVREAEAMLVIGTSLAVYSGLRFVRAAAERRIPIAILNAGETRGDALAGMRVDGRAGELLPALAARLA